MTARQRISFNAAKVGDIVELKDTVIGNTVQVRVAAWEEEERSFSGRHPFHTHMPVLVSADGRRFPELRDLLPGEADDGYWSARDAYETTLLLPNERDLLAWSVREVRQGVDHVEGHPDDLRSYADALKRVTDFVERSLAADEEPDFG